MDLRAKSCLDSVDGRPEKLKCMICGRTCNQKRLSLPCGCSYCKKCLQGYFKRRQHVQTQQTFNCPHCSSEVKCPKRPITEWTKDFKLPHHSTFYPEPPEATSETENKPTENGHSGIAKRLNGSNFLRVQSVPTGPRRNLVPNPVEDEQQRRPSAKLFQGHESELAFYSNVSSDNRTCQYWGGDLLPSDNCVVLADWMNKSVKIFHLSGECKTSFQIMEHYQGPLCVTFMHHDIMVVSFGARQSSVLFLRLTREPSYHLKPFHKILLNGYLYDTTRVDKLCFGIFEDSRTHRISIAKIIIQVKSKSSIQVENNIKVEYLPPRPEVEISSDSSIHYCSRSRKMYITKGSTLHCVNIDGRLVRKQRCVFDKVTYHLGSVRTLGDSILVASDLSVLRLDDNLNLLTVIPTRQEPYCLLPTVTEGKFLVMGRGDDVNMVTVNVKDKGLAKKNSTGGDNATSTYLLDLGL